MSDCLNCAALRQALTDLCRAYPELSGVPVVDSPHPWNAPRFEKPANAVWAAAVEVLRGDD